MQNMCKTQSKEKEKINLNKMLKKIFKVREFIKNILNRKNYLILFISVSLLTFLVFYLLTLATVTDQSLGIFIMMNGFWYTLSTFFLLAVIALLFGVYVSLLAFKIKLRCKGKGIIVSIFGGSGLIVGLFGAGCPMCGAALFALFGAPLALFFLPFKGIELRLLSIILLSLSIYLRSRSLIECKIK